ncbi:MAG: 2-hydroxychromene-2-carboxylate isomerase [Myxococcota bacterium]
MTANHDEFPGFQISRSRTGWRSCHARSRDGAPLAFALFDGFSIQLPRSPNMPIRFYFDFISPFAYLAWKALPRLETELGKPCEPVPILLAALLNHHGHKGPAEIPPKRVYIFKQCLRIAAREDLHLSPPAAHPFNPLLGLRIATLPDLTANERHRLIDVLFDATWGPGDGIDSREKVEVALKKAGFESERLIEQATADENKARLQAATEKAITAGVFGVPSIAVGDEIFWGHDALPDVMRFVRGEDPVTDSDLARWKDLPEGARRQ